MNKYSTDQDVNTHQFYPLVFSILQPKASPKK